MLRSALIRFNRARCWHRRVRVGPDRLRATSLDRLIYLWKWRWLGHRGAEATFLKTHLKPGMHVVDAGANLGAYSHFFAQCVGPTGRVTAFEPDPLLFSALAGNARANGRPQIQPHCIALGESSGHAQLTSGGFNSGDNRLAPCESIGEPGFEIPVTTLDDFLGGTKVDFIKMDIQGWELHALRGMTRTLAANPHLQLYLELWPHGLFRAGGSPEELFEVLTRHGFHFQVRLEGIQLSSLDFSALGRRSFWFTDIYAWRP